MTHIQLRLAEAAITPQPERHVSLGRHLIQTGALTPSQLFFALERQSAWDATLGEILLGEGWVTEPELLDAYALHFHARQIDLDVSPPDPALAGVLDPGFCLRHAVVPWRRGADGLVFLATSRPDRLDRLRPHLPTATFAATPVIVPQYQVQTHTARLHRRALLHQAETRVDASESCRGWESAGHARMRMMLALIGLAAAALMLAPGPTLAVLMIWALVTLIGAGLLKYTAFLSWLHLRRSAPPDVPAQPTARLPRISVIVPLYREQEIATALIRRLEKLSYPKALLDVILVLEEHDDLTHATIARTRLPGWIRVVEAPLGSGLTTKPRALNYALDFCRGDIIGIWDAEDAPAHDQLERVAARFAAAPPETACLQGILDYYNPYASWIARCFTIEYATWFRLVLPGLSHLGLAIPLGGTTLFMRRDVLEEIGGWDAHNVTEDADLGIRLARHSYRTELLDTVTGEEANCRAWPWIRQRSRWLKGYMVTYLVHMRSPRRLLAQLGWRQFLGVQAIFLITVSQFLLAPLIWSFWLVPLGAAHPLGGLIGPAAGWAVSALFLTVFFGDLLVSLTAIARQGRRRLMPAAATLWLYFPLATVAAYKGLFELVARPFFWDKTAHGHSLDGEDETGLSAPVRNPPSAG